MKEQIVNAVLRGMSLTLSQKDLFTLSNVLSTVLKDVEIVPTTNALTYNILNNTKLVEMYLVCLKVNAIEESSINKYRYYINRFREYILDSDLLKVDTNTIRCFIIHLEDTGSGNVTRDNVRRILNAFYEWLVNNSYTTKNPVKPINKIKEPVRVKKFFTDEEIELARKAVINKREKALIEFLVSIGLRVGEVAPIKTSDIDWKERSIKVLGKGNKERYVYLNDAASKAIVEYIQEREAKGIVSDYLLCKSKKPYNVALSEKTLEDWVRTIGIRANIPELHIHGIRAWHINYLKDQGVPAQVIQVLVGHESFNTTLKYYCKPNNAIARDSVLKYVK